MKIRMMKTMAILVNLIFLNQILNPAQVYALTSGAAQPESGRFTPAGATELVDLFTGDFSYNVPLMDIGGYPINLSYRAGVSMDDEASWVGLGWTLNPGAINRQLRGQPDDFNGDEVTIEKYRKPHKTWGVSAAPNYEALGLTDKDAVSVLLKNVVPKIGYSRNNYTGAGWLVGSSFGGEMASKMGFGVGLELSTSSTEGMTISGTTQMATGNPAKNPGTMDVMGLPKVNSRVGLTELKLRRAPKVSGGRYQGNSFSKYFPGGLDISTPLFYSRPADAMNSVNARLAFQGGSEVFLSDIVAAIDGYYAVSALAFPTATYKAYGYNYLENHYEEKIGGNEFFLLDYSREADGMLTKGIPNLPFSSLDQDVFTASANGLSTSFRAHRYDVGTVHEPATHNVSQAMSLGFELALGNAAKGGTDFGGELSHSSTSSWDNSIENLFRFKSPSQLGLETNKSYYFKASNELVGVDPTFRADFLDREPVTTTPFGFNQFLDVMPSIFGGKHKIAPGITTYDYAKVFSNDLAQIPSKPTLGTNIVGLTAFEASQFGFQRSIEYKDDNGDWVDVSRVNVETGGLNRKAHHLSEFAVTQPDGSKFIYGLPVYNKKQVDTDFRIADSDSYGCDRLFTYSPGTDDAEENGNGVDEHFERKTSPSYPHTFLISAITTSDYIDVTGDGVTDDDHGSAVRFNYKRPKYGDNDYFKWRAPYGENQAKVNEGLESDDFDQTASYVYGEKEIYYVESIESKNFIALFHTSSRQDGLGVKGEHGGKDPLQTVQRLDKIELFSKENYIKNQSPTPIKTVHFEYSYELCNGVLNHKDYSAANDYTVSPPVLEHGKLTLKKVYFTYGTSTKGALSSYQFEYNSSNPNYDEESLDRWGVYTTPEDCDALYDEPLGQFPYARQAVGRDDDVAAWSLTDVLLPSGGRITVDYESDDYSHVQNKSAMRMFDIVATRNVLHDMSGIHFANDFGEANRKLRLHDQLEVDKENGVTDNKLDIVPFNYLLFELDEVIPVAYSQEEANAIVEKLYGTQEVGFKGIREKVKRILFKCYVEVKNITDKSPKWQQKFKDRYEFVSGFAEVEEYGATNEQGSPTGSFTHGYVKLKSVKMSSRDNEKRIGNPIAKESWNFFLKGLSKYIYAGSEPKTTDISAFRGLLNAFTKDVRRMVQGMYKSLRGEGYATHILKGKSKIRLVNPNRKKMGGGHRVASIRMQDNWQVLTGSPHEEAGGVYGQDYNYTRHDNYLDKTVSSGVAANEPFFGWEACALHQFARSFEFERKLAANSFEQYVDPMGKKYLPGASVGYERVTVTSYKPAGEAGQPQKVISGTGTGSTVHAFYTTRDFPTRFKQTRIAQKMEIVENKIPLTYIEQGRYLGFTQGFYVETNDMNGRPKYIKTYEEKVNPLLPVYPLSSVEYHYGEDEQESMDEIEVYGADGKRKTVAISDLDVVFETRQIETKNLAGNAQANADFSFFGVIPVFAATGWMRGSQHRTLMRYATCTKHMHRKSLLRRVETSGRGIKGETAQLAWDVLGGNSIESQSLNEFGDPAIGFSYPAYWEYKNMGAKSERQHQQIEGVTFTGTNELQMPNPAPATQLKNGDVVVLLETRPRIPWGYTPLASTSLKWFPNGAFESRILNYQQSRGYTPYDRYKLWYWNGYLINELGRVFSPDRIQTSVNSTRMDLMIIDPVETNQMLASMGSISSIQEQVLDGSGQYQHLDKVVSASAVEFSERWRTNCCGFKIPEIGKMKPCGDGPCDVVNPYLKGVLGKWRPDRNWTFLSERKSSMINPGDNPDLRNDGTLMGFGQFWTYDSNQESWNSPAASTTGPWQYVTHITEYDENGVSIEETNALDIPSAAVYGFDGMVPIAVGQNASYSEIAFDGFEDYNYKKTFSGSNPLQRTTDFSQKCVYEPHYGFVNLSDGLFAHRTTEQKHSGKHSLEVDPVTLGQNYLSLSYDVASSLDLGALNTPFELGEGDCFSRLSLEAEQDYTLSAWLKEEVNQPDGFQNAHIKLSFVGSGQPDEIFYATGNLVEGWQRAIAHFTVPTNTTEVIIRYQTDAGVKAWFDDFRLHPKDGALVTYVYEPLSLRLTAVQDQNNYSSFYEYDAEGNMVRVKKETDKGLVTLQENRVHVVQ